MDERVDPEGNGNTSSMLRELEAGYNLPALSPAALKLVELAADESCSAADLAEVIDKDPSLAVRLLKLANSAFFQSRQPVASLEQAVVKVGFHRLRMMALTLSLRDTFPMGKVGAMDYERFWRSSLYRALLAKSLARNLGNCHPEEAFVAGLVLEIGQLILFELFIKGREEDASFPRDPLKATLEEERDRFGLNHRQIGEVALRYWKFPETIVSCQARYGDDAKIVDMPVLCGICHLAGSLAGILLQGNRDFMSFFRTGETSLGIKPNVLNDILLETFLQVQDIADQLRLSLDGEKDLLGIMEKANQALSGISEKMTERAAHQAGDPLPTFDNICENGETVTRTLEAVAHEIRNPLMAVGGLARRLADALEPSSAGGKYARFILEEAERLERALSRMTAPEASER